MAASLSQRLFGVSFRAEPAHSVADVLNKVARAQREATQGVIIGRSDDTVADARKLFDSADLHHLPVLEDTKPVGIVSVTDLLQFYADPNHGDPTTTSLREIMTMDPQLIEQQAPMQELISTLAHSRFRCLLVVSANGEFKNIVTTRDLVRFLEMTME